MFVALPLPEAVKDDLAEFLEPRQEAGPALRWTLPAQWHVTLAFLGEVVDRHTDELSERLQRAASRRNPLVLRVAGAGAFPHAGHAKVLWAGLEHDGEELMRLAGGGPGRRRGGEVRGRRRWRTVPPAPDAGPVGTARRRYPVAARPGPVFRSVLAGGRGRADRLAPRAGPAWQASPCRS
jgi:2''-5'' RNA ligase